MLVRLGLLCFACMLCIIAVALAAEDRRSGECLCGRLDSPNPANLAPFELGRGVGSLDSRLQRPQGLVQGNQRDCYHRAHAQSFRQGLDGIRDG